MVIISYISYLYTTKFPLVFCREKEDKDLCDWAMDLVKKSRRIRDERF